jgi:NusA-like KH domain protein
MRLTSDEIFYLNALNTASGANARDCVIQGKVIAFLLKKKELGKAIGKDASAVKKLRQKLKLNVELLEYAEGVEEFIKKALYNVKVKRVQVSEKNGKKIASVSLEPGEKRTLLNGMARVKRIKALAQRNYNIDDIKIH